MHQTHVFLARGPPQFHANFPVTSNPWFGPFSAQITCRRCCERCNQFLELHFGHDFEGTASVQHRHGAENMGHLPHCLFLTVHRAAFTEAL